MLDLGSAADMFVGLDPRGGPAHGPAVACDLGSAADMSSLAISAAAR